MNQFQCVDCARSFTEEGLRQHNRDKHGMQMEQVASKAQPVNKTLQPKNFLSKIHKKRILKYSLLTILAGFIITIALIHHSSTNKKSNDAPTAYALGGTGTKISVGSKAPDFTLPSSTGNKVSLSDYKGKKNVLLYFMEGVMCDPCWQQTLDIEKEYGKFQSKDIELITITVDPLNAVTKNARRFGITLPILADEDLKISSSYDVLKDAMHPGERPGHTFILVDKEGNIVWKKAYFLASGSTKMTMNMNGQPMTMDMGMDMGTPDSVMYLPVNKLLSDLAEVEIGSSSSSASPSATPTMSEQMSVEDHSMCLTPIHNHVDFKMYLGGNLLNFSQNNYMDQSNIVHFHKTVKVKPDDISGKPNGLLIHVHKEGVAIWDFLRTLDIPFNLDNIKGLKVYANGNIQSSGLNYVLKDKDRVLVTDSANESEIKQLMDSVTDYAIQGKDKNPSLFGGC